MLTRRLFAAGLLAAPAIVRTPGLLMPVRAILDAPDYLVRMMQLFDEGVFRIHGETDAALRARFLAAMPPGSFLGGTATRR